MPQHRRTEPVVGHQPQQPPVGVDLGEVAEQDVGVAGREPLLHPLQDTGEVELIGVEPADPLAVGLLERLVERVRLPPVGFGAPRHRRGGLQQVTVPSEEPPSMTTCCTPDRPRSPRRWAGTGRSGTSV